MKKTSLQLLALLATLSAVGAVMGSARFGGGSGASLRDIAGYRQWARVTPKAVPILQIVPAELLTIGA
jgi:hypothetical protein